MSSSTRPSTAWIVVAHVIGGVLIGALESWRLGSLRVALVMLPVFAATGLLAGCTNALAERLMVGQARAGRWWLVAAVIAAPTLIVTLPVCATLFDGAKAQTLPLASALPYLVPLGVWLFAAVAVAIGRRLA